MFCKEPFIKATQMYKYTLEIITNINETEINL